MISKKLSKWIAYHPKTVLIICLILIIPSIIGFIMTGVNYDILSYLPEDIESVQGNEILDKTFHNSASSFIIIKDTEPKDIQKLEDQIRQIDGVSNVIGITDIADPSIPQEILPEVLTNVFYSQDGSSTLIMVQYENSGASQTTMDAIASIRKIMNKNMLLSGLSAITVDTKDLTNSEAPIYIALAIALALIALSFTMTSWILPFVLLAALGTAVIYNMGTNIIFGEISFVTQSIAAILQLGVTVDYSVFLMDRFEEEKKNYDTKKDAMAVAIDSTFLSLMGSSMTTVFGFLALCFMSFTLGKDMGLVMAKGVILGVFTVVTFLPSLILMLDTAIEKTRHRSLAPKFDKLSTFAIKHRKIFVAIFVLLFIPAYFLQSNVNKYYNMAQAIPQDLPSISALNTMKKDFNMSTTHFIIIDEDLSSSKINAMTSELDNVDGVTNVLSLNSFVGTAIPNSVLPDEIKAICVQGGKQLMMINSAYSVATDEENAQINKINSIVKKYDPDGILTGEGVMTKDLIEVTDRDFIVTGAISMIAIFILVAIVFKSISIPVILVAAIELAIWVNIGMSTITGATICFITPTIINCVQLGATVDYAILMTTRFREELRRSDDKLKAIKIAAQESSRSIFQSALVFFCATFGVFLICNIDIVKGVCLMLARGSLISAAVIMLMLPGLLLTCEGIINRTSLGWCGSSDKRARKIRKAKA